MVAVLLIPVAVLVIPCLLALLERRLVAPAPAARAPVARHEPRAGTDALAREEPAGQDVPAGPEEPAAQQEPVAPVVPLHAAPSIDGDTIPLSRAS